MPSPFPLADLGGELARDFLDEWREVVARDGAHACIVCWVPFNESWGVLGVARDPDRQAFVRDVVAWTRRADPTRPVCDNSGWAHVDTDVVDGHDYTQDPGRLRATWEAAAAGGFERPAQPVDPEVARAIAEAVDLPKLCAHLGIDDLHDGLRFLRQDEALVAQDCVVRDDAVVLLSEMGGVGLVLPGEHTPPDAFVYNSVPDSAALLERFEALVTAIESVRGVEGWCWTQLADTGQEINGLLTAGRRAKLSADAVAAVLRRCAAGRAGS